MITTNRVGSEGFTVEVISVCGIEGEPVHVDAEDRHQVGQPTLNVWPPSKQMDWSLERLRRNCRPSVPSGHTIAQQKFSRDGSAQLALQKSILGHDDYVHSVIQQPVCLIDNAAQIAAILDVSCHRHEWARPGGSVKMSLKVVALPLDV